jgi:hypothetical protein
MSASQNNVNRSRSRSKSSSSIGTTINLHKRNTQSRSLSSIGKRAPSDTATATKITTEINLNLKKSNPAKEISALIGKLTLDGPQDTDTENSFKKFKENIGSINENQINSDKKTDEIMKILGDPDTGLNNFDLSLRHEDNKEIFKKLSSIFKELTAGKSKIAKSYFQKTKIRTYSGGYTKNKTTKTISFNKKYSPLRQRWTGQKTGTNAWSEYFTDQAIHSDSQKQKTQTEYRAARISSESTSFNRKLTVFEDGNEDVKSTEEATYQYHLEHPQEIRDIRHTLKTLPNKIKKDPDQTKNLVEETIKNLEGLDLPEKITDAIKEIEDKKAPELISELKKLLDSPQLNLVTATTELLTAINPTSTSSPSPSSATKLVTNEEKASAKVILYAAIQQYENSNDIESEDLDTKIDALLKELMPSLTSSDMIKNLEEYKHFKEIDTETKKITKAYDLTRKTQQIRSKLAKNKGLPLLTRNKILSISRSFTIQKEALSKLKSEMNTTPPNKPEILRLAKFSTGVTKPTIGEMYIQDALESLDKDPTSKENKIESIIMLINEYGVKIHPQNGVISKRLTKLLLNFNDTMNSSDKNKELIIALVNAGTNINQTNISSLNPRGDTSLHLVCPKNLFAECNRDIITLPTTNVFHENALQYAANQGAIESTKILFQDYDQADRKATTTFQKEVYGNIVLEELEGKNPNLTLIKELIDNGATFTHDQKKAAGNYIDTLLKNPPPRNDNDIKLITTLVSAGATFTDAQKEVAGTYIDTLLKGHPPPNDNDIKLITALLAAGATFTDDQKKVAGTYIDTLLSNYATMQPTDKKLITDLLHANASVTINNHLTDDKKGQLANISFHFIDHTIEDDTIECRITLEEINKDNEVAFKDTWIAFKGSTGKTFCFDKENLAQRVTQNPINPVTRDALPDWLVEILQ